MFGNKKFTRCFASAVTILILVKMFNLVTFYSELFYMDTFLPKKGLAPQTRRAKSNLSEDLSAYATRNQNPRILCLITTSPDHHQDRAAHVAATWANHCTAAIFLTSENDFTLPNSFVIPEAPSYKDLWTKVSKGFLWLIEEDVLKKHDCDWVIKADDDSFLLVGNLRKALKKYNPDRLIAAGLPLTTWDTNEVYLNGGAGYVLSRASVSHFVNKGLKKKQCNEVQLGRGEDVDMSTCLTHIGVTFVDLNDSSGRKVFHMYPPSEELDPREEVTWKHLWLKLKSLNSYKFGFSEMSEEPISFHYVDAETMYLLYYFTYVLQT